MSADDAATSSVVQFQRDGHGKFLPGSGGRVKGSRNRVSNEALQAVKGMKDDAIQQLRSKLDKGDWDAIVFVLSRVLPKNRSIELEATDATTIATALANGELTPEEAADIAATIAKLNEIGELEQLRSRIADLEKMVAGDGAATR